jgi:hypothetical protein
MEYEVTESRTPESYWHLDKRIPVFPLIAFLGQSAAIVWWAASIQATVTDLEEDVASQGGHGDRILMVETRLAATNEAVIALGQQALRMSDRLSTTEGNRFTAADGVALEARVNDRIDDSFERLEQLIELLRDDVRALRSNQQEVRE